MGLEILHYSRVKDVFSRGGKKPRVFPPSSRHDSRSFGKDSRHQTVKSTEIRKVVKLALSQLLPDVKITQEAGHWCYRGSYQSQDVCIAIDYSARYTQLRYDVSVSDKERGINLKGLTFERTMRILIMGWDCLEQANLDQSIARLTDLILYCVELPKRLPA